MPTVKKTVKKKPTKKKTPKAEGIMGRVRSVEEMQEEGIKLNVYGRSGTGKTTFWSTFPGPILALIASGGNRPGELRSVNTKENQGKIKSLVLEEASEVLEVAEYLRNNPDEYQTVVLDHATGLQDLVLKDLLNLDEAPVQLSWGLASQQQWGQVAVQMKQYLRKLLDLPSNVIIIAQEREFDVGVESDVITPYVASALSPSITGWLNPACDYICQTLIRQNTVEKTVKVGNKQVKKKEKGEGVTYCLRTGPSDIFTTKFRLPKGKTLPEVIEDPSYDKFMELLSSK